VGIAASRCGRKRENTHTHTLTLSNMKRGTLCLMCTFLLYVCCSGNDTNVHLYTYKFVSQRVCHEIWGMRCPFFLFLTTHIMAICILRVGVCLLKMCHLIRVFLCLKCFVWFSKVNGYLYFMR